MLDHVCKEKLTYKVEKKCATRDVKEVNIVFIVVLSPERQTQHCYQQMECTVENRNVLQCRKVRRHTEVDEFKIVKEKVCREIPPTQECKFQTVITICMFDKN